LPPLYDLDVSRFLRGVLFVAGVTIWADSTDAKFRTAIRPALEANCAACHNPANPRNRIDFLKSTEPTDVETRRGLWRNVATQLRNRTMPPGESKLSESDRLMAVRWIDERLRTSGCSTSEYAGYVPPRRLNRREYRNTIRDLFGLDLPVADLFPADESGGAGFDTHGETLYLPPMMLERYLEAAQKIVDRVLISPPLNVVVLSHEMEPKVPAPPPSQKPMRQLAPGEELSTTATVFGDASYGVRVSVERPRVTPFPVEVKVDGVTVGKLSYPRDANGGATARVQNVNLSRGAHAITIVNGPEPIDFYSVTVVENRPPETPDQRAMHFRLLGLEPGQTPVSPDFAARQLFRELMPRAYRRPLKSGELDRIYSLYERSARRGDPYIESLKYALKAVLVSPNFLFRIEEPPPKSGLGPISDWDLASRLSYFLWATMPDEQLVRLAAEGTLHQPDVLLRQVDRMLDDPRSRAFADAFVGQWLGTQEIGGRAMPLLTELQHFYTPEVAADLREQPQLFFHYLLVANRPVLDLLDAPYTFLTERLERYYELEGKVALNGAGFQKVDWPDSRRAGVLGLAGVLGMHSHYKQTSPVLRGAWVLETLLGTPVPPPPPDVPPLEAVSKPGKQLTVREMLAAHRENTACASCHNLMDPIGLGLENFDWMGRWRDTEANGTPVVASGRLPSGEEFNGPVELRAALLAKKEDFLRQIVTKTLGYALGRGQQDGDHCVVQGIMSKLERNNYETRTLIREIVLSAPFRYAQAPEEVSSISESGPKRGPRRLLGTK
jgi:hypothetical protein